jgi:hypothetical protein
VDSTGCVRNFIPHFLTRKYQEKCLNPSVCPKRTLQQVTEKICNKDLSGFYSSSTLTAMESGKMNWTSSTH